MAAAGFAPPPPHQPNSLPPVPPARTDRRTARNPNAMTQNIYDTPDFFTAYSQLPRSVHGLDAAPEWPVLRAMLPDLTGKRVPDLGCGYGWFSRWACGAGAGSVLALDVSERMLARARTDTEDPAIAYRRQDLETVALPHAAFDLAYSSLVLHYLQRLDRQFAGIHAALVPGGTLVFAVEHPTATAPAHPAFTQDATGRKSWPLNGYFDEGPRVTDWRAKGVIKQHRTVATYLNLLAGAGFRITRIEEWSPSPEQVAAHPDWADERTRPLFLLVAASR